MSDGKIFISYRRADSAYAAGRLFDRLSDRFGEEQVFMDVEHLDPGVNFVEAINKAVSECDVLIALIGPQWLDAQDENGNRRLENSLDFVRLEISVALERQIRVIPILLQGAFPPQKDQLPEILQDLAQLNAFEIRHARFNADADKLVRAIETYRVEDAERREREAAEQAAQELAEHREREVAEKAAREQAEREQRAREFVQQEIQITDCLEKANAAMGSEDWQTAKINYRNILKLRQHHTIAQNGFQTASQNLELAQLYGQAILLQDEGRFENALRILRRIQGKDGNYRDVPALILAIETLIAEQARKDDDTPQPWKQRLLDRISTLPRGLLYLGGGTGLILMLVLVIWGGRNLIGNLSKTPRPDVTTEIAAEPTQTYTLRPPTATKILLPTETQSPEPTITTIADLPQFITDDFGVSMALVPSGPFEMGSEDGNDDEKPIHTVTLDDFYIDQYEVNNARYADCVEAGACTAPSNNESYSRESYFDNLEFANYPVIYIDWMNARNYCEWRDAHLPTEAEWEKAARGNLENKLYPWGDEAPVCESSATSGAKFDDGEICNKTDTEEVGSYSANGYGLYDMAGNVWEWTQSIWAKYPYDSDDGRENLDSYAGRVLRGGSWSRDANYLRVSQRYAYGFSTGNHFIGFRCARDASVLEPEMCVVRVTVGDILSGIFNEFGLQFPNDQNIYYFQDCTIDPPRCSDKKEYLDPNTPNVDDWVIIDDVDMESCENHPDGLWILQLD